VGWDMEQNSKPPLDAKPQITADGANPVPDSLLAMFMARGEFEEAVIAKIKVAYDRKDSASVYRLVGKLLYSGPGITGNEKAQK